MPKISIWFIRTSLIYLLLGFSAGGLLLFQKGVNLEPGIWLLLPLHIEWMFIGWIFQLAMGVAFWILPRFPKPPIRGKETSAILSYFLLNTGMLLIFVDNLLQLNGILSFFGRISEALAVLCFAIHAWPRVRAFSDQQLA